MDELKQKVLRFIKTQALGVISTVDPKGSPEAAVIGISEKDDLSLIFGTFNTSRKYQNIKNNFRVALVIGWANITVQYEGNATELFGEEREETKQTHGEKSPTSQKFAELPEQTYFKIVPTWIRYTDYSDGSLHGNIFEINF